MSAKQNGVTAIMAVVVGVLVAGAAEAWHLLQATIFRCSCRSRQRRSRCCSWASCSGRASCVHPFRWRIESGCLPCRAWLPACLPACSESVSLSASLPALCYLFIIKRGEFFVAQCKRNASRMRVAIAKDMRLPLTMLSASLRAAQSPSGRRVHSACQPIYLCKHIIRYFSYFVRAISEQQGRRSKAAAGQDEEVSKESPGLALPCLPLPCHAMPCPFR